MRISIVTLPLLTVEGCNPKRPNHVEDLESKFWIRDKRQSHECLNAIQSISACAMHANISKEQANIFFLMLER